MSKIVWTTPKSWSVGELVTAANLNLHVRDNMNFLYNIPRYRAFRTTALSITNATTIGLDCDSQRYDIGGLFAPTDNSFTTNITGLWTMMCGYQLVSGTWGGVQSCLISTGVTTIAEIMWQRNSTNAEEQSLSVTGHKVLSASTVVDNTGWQNSGSARNTTITVDFIDCWHAGSWKGA